MVDKKTPEEASVDEWNERYPPGTLVAVTRYDGKVEHRKTRSEAWLLGSDQKQRGHTAVVLLAGINGAFRLSACAPVTATADATAPPEDTRVEDWLLGPDEKQREQTATQPEETRVENWNEHCPPGTLVAVKRDGGTVEYRTTRSAAWLLGADEKQRGHTAVVLLNGITGAYLLSRCARIKVVGP